MTSFARRVVTRVVGTREGLQRLLLDDGSSAFALTQVVGEAEPGDEVVVNTTAVERSLGTGGRHIVHCNLAKLERSVPGPGHIMAVRYMSEQLDVGSWEESAEADLDLPDLSGVRVALCVLHSHVTALIVGAADVLGAPSHGGLAYVMSDQAALPLALSDNIAELRRRGLLDLSISAGQAFGGDLEAVNVASGVHAALVQGRRRVVVGGGPGHVGTSTALGFSALELAGHGHVLTRLGAEVGLVVRASAEDPRDRHRGVSHHTRTLARLLPDDVVVPVPPGDEWAGPWLSAAGLDAVAVEPVDIVGALARQGLGVDTMGRRLVDDDVALAYLGASVAWLVGRDR